MDNNNFNEYKNEFLEEERDQFEERRKLDRDQVKKIRNTKNNLKLLGIFVVLLILVFLMAKVRYTII